MDGRARIRSGRRRFGRVTIIGVGLIGGSIGMGLRRRRVAQEVVGVFRRAGRITAARRLGAIDRGTVNLAAGVRGAEVVILATPIRAAARLAIGVARHLGRGAVLTDVASTKGEFVRELEARLPDGTAFVGGHPLAGSEQSGVSSARPDLFESALCILTRTRRTNRHALRRVEALWAALGARVELLSPERHDRVMALVSHLPHLAAAALLYSIGPRAFPWAAAGLRDTTRVASGEPAMWGEIVLSNRAAILEALNEFDGSWGIVRTAIRRRDGRTLGRFLRTAKRYRATLTGSPDTG